MAQRTTVDAVRTLLATNRDYNTRTAPDLQQFIDTAVPMVDRVQTKASAAGDALTTAELELIERWLSAWAYAMLDQQLQSRSANGVSGSFKGQSGMGLEANNYGQTAMRLDRSGTLRALDKGNRGSISWGGTEESSWDSYEDRN